MEPRSKGWRGALAAVAIAVGAISLVGCGGEGATDADEVSDGPSSADTATVGDVTSEVQDCAAELHDLNVADTSNVVGCGEEVIIREDQVNEALGTEGWSEDSGEVNQPMEQVLVLTCEGEEPPFTIVGAQVVELGDYGDTGGEFTAWENVLVFASEQKREQFQKARTDAMGCRDDGDELEGISPDGNFVDRIQAPATTIDTLPEGVVVLSRSSWDGGSRPVAVLGSGPYYAELYLSSTFLVDETLNEQGTALVNLAVQRLQAG